MYGRSDRGPSQIAFSKAMQNYKGIPKSEAMTKQYTADEVFQHNVSYDCWVTCGGYVYDLTPYIQYHPGGITCLQSYYGYDITTVVKSVHPWVNYALILEKLIIGVLNGPPKYYEVGKPKVERGRLIPANQVNKN